MHLARQLLCTLVLASSAFAGEASPVSAGVGRVDITPAEAVVLAGSPSPKKASEVKTRLYVRALVLAQGRTKMAIVTLDTLKFPVDLANRARAKVEQATGIPASNVVICASHTHFGPLWSYYPDKLATPIADAVAQAAQDLQPCTLGTAQGTADGVSQCRRVIKDGHAWNRWQLPLDEAQKLPAEGDYDPAFDVLAVTRQDGTLKTVLYNFACHAAATRTPVISADYPGEVEEELQHKLGRAVPAMFLTGACGDVNPVPGLRGTLMGVTIGDEIARCLDRLQPVATPALAIDCHEFPMPGREHPVFNEAEVARNWPGQLEHYRKAYEDMKKREKPTYQYFITGIRISDDFAIVTNANELFCGIGLSIKHRSPFKSTMTVEQTNGAHGYVPTEKAFAGGSYETWYGEHSYLSTQAGGIIERESLELLNRLKHLP